jgi:hypothetical protein
MGNVFLQSTDTSDYVVITVGNMEPSIPFEFDVVYTITDYFDTEVKKGTLHFNSVGGATQSQRVTIDKSKPGYFTVKARIDVEGAPRNFILPKNGKSTRPPNYLNYAVFPDLATRRMNADVDNLLPGSPVNLNVDRSIYYGMAIIPGGGDRKPIYDNVFVPVTWMGIDATISSEMNWEGTFWTKTGAGSTNTAMLEKYATPGQQVVNKWTYELVDVASSLKIPPYALQEMTPYMPKQARTQAGQTGSYGGQLSAFGEAEFRKYCEGLAIIHIAQASFRPIHYYQPLWEPMEWGGWSAPGNAWDESLIAVSRIAYEAIHGIYDKAARGELDIPDPARPDPARPGQFLSKRVPADPKWSQRAVVLGVCSNYVANHDVGYQWHKSKFDKGLMNYLDGLSCHPYNDLKTSTRESSREDVFADFMRELMELTTEYYDKRDNDPLHPKYFPTPFFWGTEQGLQEAKNGSLRTAQVLTRLNLILLGEGFDANHNFCFMDYNGDQRYGFFYNGSPMIDPLDIYGSQYVSPKHPAASFAAQTWLMKGYEGVGKIRDTSGWYPFHTKNGESRIIGHGLSGAGVQGYKFKDTWPTRSKESYIYAVWDYRERGRTDVTLTLDEMGDVTVYDIMGNVNEAATAAVTGNSVPLTLTEDVQYVKVILP